MNRPTIISVEPSNNSTDVPLDIQVKAHFSQGIGHWPLDPSTVNTSTAYIQIINGDIINSVVSVVNNYTITIVPNEPLPQDTRMEVFLVGDEDPDSEESTGITDIEGNSLAGIYVWTFSTEVTEEEAEPDPSEPEEPDPAEEPAQVFIITKTKPKDKAVNVSNDTRVIEIELSNDVDPTSIIGTNIYVLKKTNL